MRQFAAHGHRVSYASLWFHDGPTANLAPIEPGVFEMSLPGTPEVNAYSDLPSDEDIERIAAAMDELRARHRIASAVVVVQLPFWAPWRKS